MWSMSCAPSLRGARNRTVAQDSRDQNVGQDRAEDDLPLVPAQVALPGFPRNLRVLHHCRRAAVRSPPQTRNLGRAVCLCRLLYGARQTGRRIDVLLLHPLAILLVDLRPLETELGPAVARLDTADAARIRAGRSLLRPAAGAIPPPRALGEQFTLVLARAHTARRHLLARHEAQQACENGADFPGRVEALGVEVGDAEAQAGAGLEAAGRGVHADGGRREGVVWREHERAPVLAAFVGGLGRPCEDVVPFEDVLLGRVGDDVGRGRFGDGGVLLGKALGCCWCGHGVMCGCVEVWRCCGGALGARR
jgi:hypothetical protein